MRTIFIAILTFLYINLYCQVKVRGYFRKDGTYVEAHYRSNPDRNPYNNWSFPGNVNPYTGKIASGSPESYLRNYYKTSSYYSLQNLRYSYPTSVNYYQYSYQPSLQKITTTLTYPNQVIYSRPSSSQTSTSQASTDYLPKDRNLTALTSAEGSYTVAKDKAYFHSLPTTSSMRSVYMIYDEQFNVTAFQNGFYYTTFSNPKGHITSGWISQVDVVKLSDYTSVENHYKVTSDKAFFRSNPSAIDHNGKYLVLGDMVQEIVRQSDFVYTIFTNNKGQTTSGWISLNDLTSE